MRVTSPSGLNLRSTPTNAQGDANKIGAISQGSVVRVEGPAQPGPGSTGWLPITVVSVTGSGRVGQQAFAAQEFLAPTSAPASTPVAPAPPPPLPAALPAPLPASTAPAQQLARVTTQTDPLRLRSAPTTDSTTITMMPKGAIVAVTGPGVSGKGATSWLPVVFSGKPGFAASDFLTPIAPGTVAV
jgi:hypothetical protein